jgi:hypothetical protein
MGCQVDSNATGLRLFVHVVCASRVHLLAPKIMVESVILPETGGVHRAAVKRQTQCDRGRGGTAVLGTICC